MLTAPINWKNSSARIHISRHWRGFMEMVASGVCLLIAVILCQWDLLSQPLLYLSSYFEKHRRDYYRLLLECQSAGGVGKVVVVLPRWYCNQSKKQIQRVQRLEVLRENYYERFYGLKDAPRLQRLVDFLIGHPIVTIHQVEEGLQVTAYKIVFYKLKSAQFIIEKVPTLKKERLKLLFKRGPLYY
jgi:hypothetical protein